MKKLLCVLVATLMIAAMFSGCVVEPGPLRICVDMAYAGGLDNNGLKQKMYDFEYEIKNFDGVGDVIFEYVPDTGAERETALDRLRTELMSGGGPDVFIIECAGRRNSIPSGEALFLMPEKAMELGLFLPLDEYMENNSQHAEWNEMTDVILDAGKTDEGQVLIPMTYSVPLAMYPKEYISHLPSKTMTWQDMLEAEELKDVVALFADGMFPDSWNVEGDTWYYGVDTPLYAMLGDLADYENEKLCFTEEELHEYVNQVFEWREYVQNSDILDREKWYEGFLGVGMTCCGWNQYETHGMKDEDIFSLIPFYSDDGGATAVILNYMAVNANSKRPEDAFKVVDRMLGRNMQQGDELYTEFLYIGSDAMPMYDDFMQASEPIYRNTYQHPNTHYSDENFQTVCEVRESIARVQFPDALSLTLVDLMLKCDAAYNKGEEYSQIVHDTYTAMELMVGE